jgi:hypothetical protein
VGEATSATRGNPKFQMRTINNAPFNKYFMYYVLSISLILFQRTSPHKLAKEICCFFHLSFTGPNAK